MTVVTQITPDLYLVDGPGGRLWRLPVPARNIVLRLRDGALWIYAPTALSETVVEAIGSLGEPRHLVIANQRGLEPVTAWRECWPDAQIYGSREVHALAHLRGIDSADWQVLDGAGPWSSELAYISVNNAWGGPESVFFHHDSRSLIIGDLIVNLETAQLAPWVRPLIWLAGIDTSDGKMPPTWRRWNKAALLGEIEQLMAHEPERILLLHGACYPRNGTGEIERAFRRLLRDRDWDRALTAAKTRSDLDQRP